MGAVFAGSARAQTTAVVILFELTGEYSPPSTPGPGTRTRTAAPATQEPAQPL